MKQSDTSESIVGLLFWNINRHFLKLKIKIAQYDCLLFIRIDEYFSLRG